MKLHSDPQRGARRITGYGSGYVSVDDERVAGSIVITPEHDVRAWPVDDADALEHGAFDVIDDLDVEIVLLGTGTRQTFPAAEILAAITARGIGIEVMTTPAACRTYNILVAEGRRVAALLVAID